MQEYSKLILIPQKRLFCAIIILYKQKYAALGYNGWWVVYLSY